MSTGRIHLQSSLILAASFSGAALVLGDARLLECAGGALVGIFITPDLDLNNEGIVQGKFIKKKLGQSFLRAWKYFWKGYSSSAKHGSWLSHSPIFSTFIRLSYAYYWVIFIPHVVFYALFFPNWSLPYVLSWYAMYLFAPFFIYGLVSSDVIHFFLDALTTKHS